MSYEWDPDHRVFLEAHMWGVLATGRKDGSPQQSMIGYLADTEGRVVISAKAYTAKWKNAIREPKVCLTVPDGREHLVVYGNAEAIESDPERAELTAAVFGHMTGNDLGDPRSMIETFDEQQRTVLRITPTKTVLHR
jgi:PPOX class probable F420-dependent enzyme